MSIPKKEKDPTINITSFEKVHIFNEDRGSLILKIFAFLDFDEFDCFFKDI